MISWTRLPNRTSPNSYHIQPPLRDLLNSNSSHWTVRCRMTSQGRLHNNERRKIQSNILQPFKQFPDQYPSHVTRFQSGFRASVHPRNDIAPLTRPQDRSEIFLVEINAFKTVQKNFISCGAALPLALVLSRLEGCRLKCGLAPRVCHALSPFCAAPESGERAWASWA